MKYTNLMYFFDSYAQFNHLNKQTKLNFLATRELLGLKNHKLQRARAENLGQALGEVPL